MSKEKLSGGDAFDRLMGKLVQVPKQSADRTARRWKAARKKKKPKKSDGG